MMKLTPPVVDLCRRQFPALSRRVGDRPAVFFDGPGGTQAPQRVMEAVSHSLAHANANHGGHFATSVENDRMLAESHRGLADFLGADDPNCVVFGQYDVADVCCIALAGSRVESGGRNRRHPAGS